MPLTRCLRRYLLVTCFLFAPALVHADLAEGEVPPLDGLISLNTAIITAEQVNEFAVRPVVRELPPLRGVAAGLTPLSHLFHNGSTWLLAEDAAGQRHWLGHFPEIGWQRKSPPPAGIHPPVTAGGQAHVLVLAVDERGQAHIHTYHTITGSWADMGATVLAGPVEAVNPSFNGFIVSARDASGQMVHKQLAIALTKRLLTWIDWLIIVVYLSGTASIGYFFFKRHKKGSNEDFFVGNRSIPWWAAGVSLYATGTSAISYIATPAKSFAENWQYLAANVVGMVGTVFVAIWIVPLIRRLNIMSVYHYLEMRFHANIRTLASGLAIILQLGGRMSIVLFLPSLAMSAVTGISVVYSVLIMGVVTIAYTVMGGMRAVIWTDFIQVLVMLGGAFIAVGYMIYNVEGGIMDFFRIAAADDKFKTFDWSFDLTKATVWGFLLVGILGVLTYPQDQVMMQRVLSTKSDKEAGWSVWTLVAIVVPGNLTFFGIGTALYVFYKQHPANLNPTLNVDSTFPQFIAAELPVGLTGLIIAGIFAASMSTLSSCINSVATLVSVDFYERRWQGATPEKSRHLAEVVTILAGLIGIGTALLLATADIKSALDTSFVLIGLLGGGFAGCYALGIFTTRTTWQGAFLGVGASLVVTFVAWIFKLVHPFFYIVIANLTCITVGYFTSYLFPAPKRSLHGLTIFTPRQLPVSAASGTSNPSL
jgi:solute:Na+ symporter, SSS family